MKPLKKIRAVVLLLLVVCVFSGCDLTVWKNTPDIAKKKEIERSDLKIESISQEEYVYQTLDEETKVVYDEVLNAILEHKKTIAVSTNDKEILDIAYNAVNADYGELFWISGYMYTQHYRGDNITGIDFSPSYTMKKEERQKTQKKIDERVKEILKGISPSDSDYNKVKYIFEVLVKQVDYNPGAKNNQNIISVFLNRETVCQGYACATQYLLDLLGVQSAIVTGKADGEAHAWNLVKMDGEYYYVDTTWGNSRYFNRNSAEEKYVNYNYLGMNSEEISISHQAETVFELPECIASRDNYYVHEGLYFDKWDPDAIGKIYRQAWQGKEKKVAVKFSTQELYEMAVDFFIREEQIANYCDGITTMYYIEDREQKILSISF
ncbi:MAG: hypothetical protein HFI37_03390 [Lachnospiraceae bacterium]|nr:hypothetical protein [Lachnospiraceae bacterium]